VILETDRPDCRFCQSAGCTVCGALTDFMIAGQHLRRYPNPHVRVALAEAWELARRAPADSPNPYRGAPTQTEAPAAESTDAR
jgi:hypothetical protein